MPQNIRNRTIKSYKVLPPRIRIVYPEGYDLAPHERYLKQVDKIFEQAQSQYRHPGSLDLVSLVFNNQAAIHAVSSSHLADLIIERRNKAEKHLGDIQWRLNEVLTRKPLRFKGIASPADEEKITDVEKQILDLEKQKREIQLGLWRDLLDLRKDLVTERREYRDTRNRMAYLAGSESGPY